MPTKKKIKGEEKEKKITHILIDTNAYLDYFRMSSATVTSLEKLLNLLKSGKLKLILTKQIKDEYLKNRKGVIYATKKQIKEARDKSLSILRAIRVPPHLERSKEGKRIKGAVDKIEKSLKEIIKKHENKSGRRTEMDKLIDNIFEQNSYEVEEAVGIIQKAEIRYLRRYPPAKNHSYGDAIIWETILEKFTKNDLIIVTNDIDWYGDSDKEELNELLKKEWKNHSKCKISISPLLAKSINPFLEEKKKIKKEIVEEEKVSKSYFTVSSGTTTTASDFTSSTSILSSDSTITSTPNTYSYWTSVNKDLDPTALDRALWVYNPNHVSLYCTNCSHFNDYGARFCSRCGKRLG